MGITKWVISVCVPLRKETNIINITKTGRNKPTSIKGQKLPIENDKYLILYIGQYKPSSFHWSRGVCN